MIPKLIINHWLRCLAFFDNQPDLDGGSGGSPPDGGGIPGTGTGSSSIPTGFPVSENGGVFGTTYLLLIPTQDIVSDRCYFGFYDVSSFDDKVDGSFYTYRREDIVKHRVPTVHRVILMYRDLGLATVSVTISGTNDDNQVKSITVKAQIGNAIATNAILTEIVDIQLTCFGPQLTLSRAAAGGPVSIVSATMEGEVEDVSL